MGNVPHYQTHIFRADWHQCRSASKTEHVLVVDQQVILKISFRRSFTTPTIEKGWCGDNKALRLNFKELI